MTYVTLREEEAAIPDRLAASESWKSKVTY
jgi:hypothetical protein